MTDYEILEELNYIIKPDQLSDINSNEQYKELLTDNNITVIYSGQEETHPWLDKFVVQYKNLFFMTIEIDDSYSESFFSDWEIVVPKTITIYEPAN